MLSNTVHPLYGQENRGPIEQHPHGATMHSMHAKTKRPMLSSDEPWSRTECSCSAPHLLLLPVTKDPRQG